MKASIPSDVWEKKKALIAKLYKDEEWPLKQVIKKIRSDNFNPSETQLRSRLKKWRVTKPSRQTRKKPQNSGDDSGNEGVSPKTQASSVSPRTPSHPIQQCDARHPPATEPEWYVSHRVYTQPPAPIPLNNQNVSDAWSLPVGQQPSPCPSEHYGSPNGSPVAVSNPSAFDAVFVNPTSTMTHGYSGAPFSVTESCMQEPVSTTAPVAPIQWTMPHWYPFSPGAVTQPPSVQFYTSAPLSPPSASPVDPTMHTTHLQPGPVVYSPRSAPYFGVPQHHMSDYFSEAKPWKRAMSLQYTPDETARLSRSDQREGQEYAERKASLPSRMTHYSSNGLITPPLQFFPTGHHPVICTPIYPYGQESLLDGPLIDF